MPFPRRLSPPGRAFARARSSKIFLFTLAAALACGLLLYASSNPAAASGVAARPSQTGLVDVTASGAGAQFRVIEAGSITPDGRFVAFVSGSPDLVPGDSPLNSGGTDVFVRDRRSGRTVLVSANVEGTGSGNFYSSSPVITPDGRYVAFLSNATNLILSEPSTFVFQDVYLRDLRTGTTTLVSQTPDGRRGNNRSGDGSRLSLSDDGRYVCFVSSANNLTPAGSNATAAVFVRDVTEGVTRLASVNQAGTGNGNNGVSSAVMTADGRYVAFRSLASDLVPNDANSRYDIFLRDMQAGTTKLVSARPDGASGNGNADPRGNGELTVSPDGRHVLFVSNADDLVPNDSNSDQDLFVNVNLPAAGQVGFAQHVFAVNESAGQAVLTVTRAAGAAGAATVSYTTLGGTAAGGSDFTPTSGTLHFAPGEESKQFTVPVLNDAADEADEHVFVKLTHESGGTVGEPALASVVIADDDPSPRLSVSDARVGEGDGGTAELTFLVTLSEPSLRTITARVVTQNGTATGGSFSVPGADYEPLNGTYTFPPGTTRGLLRVRVWPDTAAEPDETFSVVFFDPVSVELADGVGVGTIADDDGAGFTKVQFSANTQTVSETAGRLDVQVTRAGDLSAPSSVGYWSFDLSTSPRTDYAAPAGVIDFAAGESSKTLSVFITDDAFREEDETFFLLLFAPRGCTIGATSSVTVVIKSDDAADAPSPARQQGDTPFFVRQHYRDFLGRDPDAEGLAFWTGEIEQCGANQQCREVKRVNVSAAFFLSIEFQETGFLAYRTYKAAYGDLVGRPVPVQLFWFTHDAQQIGRGVVVNQGDWRGQLEQNKRDYFDYFVRDEFFNLVYPASLTPAEFVGALDANAGGVLTPAERAALAAALAAGTKTRAEVLRAVAEHAELARREFNRAFVLMQYFGYLRRNPDEFPDADFAGYNFWLGKLEEFNGNYIRAEMVKAFISSDEYLKRFGQ